MRRRRFGRTGLDVPAIGFGCGMVGGLMVGGSAADQREAVAHALDAGIDYFDTAPFYGGGRSEENLGRALAALGRRATIGTKVRLEPAVRNDPAAVGSLGSWVRRSVEESLGRLRVDFIDLLQLHNPVSGRGTGSGLPPAMVLEHVLPAFRSLVEAGKVRCIGMTALGDEPDARQVVASAAFDAAQIAFNLLDPGAARPGGLLDAAETAGTGVIGIRLLAGGSLSGSVERHPAAMQTVIPLGSGVGSGSDYAADVASARRFGDLAEGANLATVAIRYGLSQPGLHTLAIGFSSRVQLDDALAAERAGPFDAATLERIARTQSAIGL
jgi:L-galactose dehydrogenase/L-glyceraldehyde 3-phosphate reductase